MGLIKAAMNATSGTLKDQYKELIYCESMPMDVLITKGKKVIGQGNTNKGLDNVITDGSNVAVADGQCMLIVEDGNIVEFSAEPGNFIYSTGTTPSLLTGGFKGLKDSFKTLWERTQTGGMRAHDQRVYYVNMKEIMGNKFGAGDIPFRDSEFMFTMKIKCFGEYSYKITDPLMFYKNVSGNVTGDFERGKIDSQFKAEVQTALQPALGRIALKKIPYDQLILFTKDIAVELNREMSEEWENRRGIKVESFALASVTPDEESAQKIEQFQSSRVYTDARMMGARIGEAQANAMENAASNEGGAMNGFFGLGMAQGAGGMNSQKLFEMSGQNSQEQPNPFAAAVQERKEIWKCPGCQTENGGKFCEGCGEKKPAPAGAWKCSCGVENTGKFCMECGKKKEVEQDARCEGCGYQGTAPFRFCPDCGAENKE